MVVANPTAESIEHLKSQFLASLNHEIRTPLSGIIGMTDLLLESSLDGEQREYVSATRLCAESLLEILNATLEYSALASGSAVLDDYEFNLAEALEMAVAEHVTRARAKGLKLFLTFDEDLPETIHGDARRFRQMITQVLKNAVKFTNSGQIEVRAQLDGATLSIQVKDSGIGIPPEKLEVIFDSFRQADGGLARSHSGLGLGLALARRIATLLGGEITVQSQVGAGSTFTIRMPLQSAQAAGEKPEYAIAGLASAETAAWRVLVVEDNRVSQTVITHVLKRHGITTEVATCGAEALTKASATQFDLILMDLQMPDMDGLETTAHLRQIQGYLDTPILALTANYSDVYRDMARESGMQAFLSKPVKASELLSTIHKFLRA